MPIATQESCEPEYTTMPCETAGGILKSYPLDTKATRESGAPHEVLSAIWHYIFCPECLKKGLVEILGVKLSCQDALIHAATKPGPILLGLGSQIETLRDLLTSEHINGRTINATETERAIFNLGACEQDCCQTISWDWRNHVCTTHYQFAQTIQSFVQNEWPIDQLLEIQKMRAVVLVNAINTRQQLPWHDDPSSMVIELIAVITSLAEVANNGQEVIRRLRKAILELAQP